MFLVHFLGEWHSGITSYILNPKVFGSNPTDPCQWPKVGLSAAKWLVKKAWSNFTFCFGFFIAVFVKQAKIHCSINRISRPISSHDHNSTDHAIAMDRHEKNLRGRGQAVVDIIQLQLLAMQIFLHTVNVAFLSLNASINNFGRFLAKLLSWISLEVSLWSVSLQFSQNKSRFRCFFSFLKNFFKDT